MWSFFAVEFAAKVLGGLLWSVVLIRRGHFDRVGGSATWAGLLMAT
ncbi:MAG: hypothetical protein OES24_00460 [Acidimicrobiia bacterium]|nr:hypothetical protein [Acidimicrobiia bacterium]